MNKLVFFSFLLGIAIAFSSCNTTQTFTIHGKPGTEIKGGSISTVIQQNGEANITIHKGDPYQHYFLAKEPNSHEWVPFALNYTDLKRNASTFLPAFSTIIGCTSIAAGTIALCTGEVMGAAIIGGGVLLCVPGFIYSGSGRNLQMYNYNFKYQSNQHTNNDLIK